MSTGPKPPGVVHLPDLLHSLFNIPVYLELEDVDEAR